MYYTRISGTGAGPQDALPSAHRGQESGGREEALGNQERRPSTHPQHHDEWQGGLQALG